RDAAQRVFLRQSYRCSISASKLLCLPCPAPLPDRSDSVNDISCGQIESWRDLRVAGVAKADLLASFRQCRPGRVMNCPAYAAAGGKLLVGGVDDRVYGERGDIDDLS